MRPGDSGDLHAVPLDDAPLRQVETISGLTAIARKGAADPVLGQYDEIAVHTRFCIRGRGGRRSGCGENARAHRGASGAFVGAM